MGVAPAKLHEKRWGMLQLASRPEAGHSSTPVVFRTCRHRDSSDFFSAAHCPCARRNSPTTFANSSGFSICGK
jgi:hypothetical protein